MKTILKTLLTIMVFTAFSLSLPAFAADAAKIGVVDFEKVMENSNPGREAQARINKEGETLDADLKARGEEIEKLKADLERERLVMSTEKREQVERDIRIKTDDLKALQKKYLMDFENKKRETSRVIQKEFIQVVESIGKKEGYLLIIERWQAGAVYFPDSIDITDKVIETYNKKK